MKKHVPVEFIFQLFSLIISIIIVHAIYVGIIRPNAMAVLEDVKSLKSIFDKITIKQGNVTAVEDPATNVTTLKSESSIHITPDVFKELRSKVIEIRTSYIS